MYTFICKYGFLFYVILRSLCAPSLFSVSVSPYNVVSACRHLDYSWMKTFNGAYMRCRLCSSLCMFAYAAEQNKTRNQVLLDDATVNCSVVLLDPFFTYFIIYTYPCWVGGDPYSNQGPKVWGSRTQIVKCPEAFWFVIFGLTNKMGLTSNPLPQQSGCYENSAHLNISPFQLQHQTSAPQHKKNRLCYCYVTEKCVQAGWGAFRLS